MRRAQALAWSGALAVAALSGCTSAAPWSGEVPPPDYQSFSMAAYPVLLRDCAFSECHGSGSRSLQVWGPGRTRLDPALKVDEAATQLEIQLSYERARSMLVAETPGAVPPLLAKPLEEKSGGSGHKGMDAFGRNVYQTSADPGYMTLAQWARGLIAPPVAPQPVIGAAPSPGGAAP